jgi:hypothetical protein
MSKTVTFAIATSVGICVGLAALWALTGFSSFGLDADDLAFLIPGIVLTVMVAVALMAAMVYSNRSGKDEL